MGRRKKSDLKKMQNDRNVKGPAIVPPLGQFEKIWSEVFTSWPGKFHANRSVW